jgi:hypothetical protein
MRGAKDNALLYVNADNASAGGGKVFAYTYPGGKLVGTLGAFGNPAGLCSDTAGRVYVTVGGFEGMNPSVQEYSHDGRWLAYVNVPAPWASNCSVDPTTGDLAVVNGGTDVYLYQNGRGQPIAHDSSLNNASYCGFDAAGNLFLTGEGHDRKNHLVEMAAGRPGTFKAITLDRKITPTAIQWDGAELAIETYPSGDIYRMRVSQGHAKAIARVHLVGADNSLFWISGSTVAKATDNGMKVGVWSYPEGGRHENVTKGALPYRAYGITVSAGAHGAGIHE